MIERLKIENYALLKNVEVEFKDGFNVLLGETGAGKSLILDSLSFLLGSKADKNIIRSGEEFVKVSAIFSCNDNINKLLADLGFDCGDELLVSRIYSLSGKNEVRVNGSFATTSILKEIAPALVDSFSQNEQVELSKTKNHLALVDSFSPKSINPLKEELALLIEKHGQIISEMEKYGTDSKNRLSRIDILKFQIDEIEDAKIKENEIEEISNKLSQISNSEKIINSLKELDGELFGDNISLSGLLNTSSNKLSNFSFIDGTIKSVCDRLEQISIDIEDIKYDISSLIEKYSFDGENVDSLIDRREKIERLQKKYGSTYEEINIFLSSAKEELEKLENADEKLESLSREKQQILKEIYDVCLKISNERRLFAEKMQQLLEVGLKEVGIKFGKVQIVFNEIPSKDNFAFNQTGFDDVEIMFSANAGEELKPLSKTISGGEMSRFMLALKNILADNNGVETIVFDEIDSGISGEIAEKVSSKISNLSKKYQIICITHLPQVASRGDNFIFVEKMNVEGRTQTKVSVLESENVVNQIAVMAGGSLTEENINYAKSLLNRK